MRRRFGRKKRRSADDRRAPIDARWLERIVEAGLAPVTSLEPRRYEDVPETLALTGVGQGEDGQSCVVSYAPGGSAALLGALVTGARMADEDGFAGRALAIAPEWSAEDRRLLASLGALPFTVEAIAASALRDDGPAVRGNAGQDAQLCPPERVGAELADRDARALFGRALETLRGLAAKHQGALRGVGSSVELVVLARRVATLRPESRGVVLETLQPSRERTELSEENLGEVLDRLEGSVRKRLNDRRIREGEEGKRGSLRAALASAAGLRDVRSWPLPGADPEVLDLLAVDDGNRLVLGALRERFDLSALADVLAAANRIEAGLPALSAGMEPPVLGEPPRLLLAAEEFEGAVLLALSRLTLESACFDVSGNALSARALDRAVAPVPARTAAPKVSEPAAESASEVAEPASEGAERTGRRRPARTARPERAERSEARERPERSDEAGDSETSEAGDDAARPGRRRRRGRGGRGRSSEEGEEKGRETAAKERSEAAAPSAAQDAGDSEGGFLELSLFDLDDDAQDGDEGGRGRTRRRRGRGRRGRRGANGGSEDAGADRAAVADADGPEGDREADTDDVVVDEESLTGLSPDAPDLDEPEGPVYDEEDLEESPLSASDRMRLERDLRRRARIAKAAPIIEANKNKKPEGGARKDDTDEISLPRGRAAILAHADRDSIAAAVLLAREVRQVEGIWIYPQEELMTFFRGVATDLRRNTPMYLVGFAAKPAHDALQAAALYRDRLVWFDHHPWPPEDLHALRESLGAGLVHVHENLGSSLPIVLGACTRRSRFSDKLVDLMTGRFTLHDYERWGRLWWTRIGEMAGRTGEQGSSLEPLITGRPSDLARDAADEPVPPMPREAEFAAARDFRLVHFGGYSMVVLEVPGDLDVHLAGRIVRERYAAEISLARSADDEVLVLGAEEAGGRRAMDLGSMVDHLGSKFEWATSLADADHVARLHVAGLDAHPERLDEVVSELAMGRSILEG